MYPPRALSPVSQSPTHSLSLSHTHTHTHTPVAESGLEIIGARYVDGEYRNGADDGEYPLDATSWTRRPWLTGASSEVSEPGILHVAPLLTSFLLRGLRLRGGFGRHSNVNNSSISSSSSSSDSNTTVALLGGALLVGHDTTAVMQDTLFEDCEAVEGGAVYAGNRSTLTFSRVAFLSNRARRGGAVSASANSSLLFDSCIFAHNTAHLSAAMAARWPGSLTGPGECWQARTPDYPRCAGYAGVGYTCVGDYCSAIDPTGNPTQCAEFVPRANAVDPLTGKCTGTAGPAQVATTNHSGTAGGDTKYVSLLPFEWYTSSSVHRTCVCVCDGVRGGGERGLRYQLLNALTLCVLIGLHDLPYHLPPYHHRQVPHPPHSDPAQTADVTVHEGRGGAIDATHTRSIRILNSSFRSNRGAWGGNLLWLYSRML
jgi:hypothetical protein